MEDARAAELKTKNGGGRVGAVGGRSRRSGMVGDGRTRIDRL